MTNSGDSPRFNRGALELLGVCAVLLLLVAHTAQSCFARQYILWYGDAQAHLNISRGIFDSRTPGYDQLGTVWLPLLHVLCLPLVGNNWLWSTGLAGTIPVALCFVIAGTFFYLAAREIYPNSFASLIVIACFALNPNVLYLASIPMTEVVFFAGLSVLVFACFRFRRTCSGGLFMLAIVASWWTSLTRYDGWFLIPFAAAWLAAFARRKRVAVFIAFGALASLAPLYWLAHNWWEAGNPFDFFNGPYSASAIQGSAPYPGYHDWTTATKIYAQAAELCAGWGLVILAAAGFLVSLSRRTLLPLLFLALTPVFYIWSVHSSKLPIFIPQLWGSYYNTRYGVAFLPFAAFAAGALAYALPGRWNKLAWVIPLVAATTWLLRPTPENVIVWKESQVNSISRRAWTQGVASFLTKHWKPGQGILTSAGDVTGIYCRAQIPLANTLNIGNGPAWFATTSRPDLVHGETWAVAQAGDFLSKALHRERRNVYEIVKEIKVKDAPAVEIYRRHEE